MSPHPVTSRLLQDGSSVFLNLHGSSGVSPRARSQNFSPPPPPQSHRGSAANLHFDSLAEDPPTFCPPSGGSLRAAQAPRVSPPLHTSQSLQGGGGGVSEAFAVGPTAQGITSAPLTSCPQGPSQRPRWARLLYGRRQRWQPLGRGFERPSWRRWQGHRNSEYRTVTAGLQARPPAFEL